MTKLLRRMRKNGFKEQVAHLRHPFLVHHMSYHECPGKNA